MLSAWTPGTPIHRLRIHGMERSGNQLRVNQLGQNVDRIICGEQQQSPQHKANGCNNNSRIEN